MAERNTLSFTETGSLNVPARILLADDDNLIRTLIQRILEQNGHTVTAAADGEDAAALFSPGRYDLLITDIMMPGIDGFELVAHVKKIDPDIEVIMITGAPTTQLALDALRNDKVADFIVKPFDHAMLRQTVSRVLRERRMRQFSQTLSNQLNATLERQSQQILLLSDLVQIQSKISSSLNEHEVLEVAVQEANSLLKCDWAAALVVNADGRLRLDALAGFETTGDTNLLNSELSYDMHPFLRSLGLSALAKTTKLKPGDNLSLFLGLDEPNTLVVAPLVASGEVYGALLIGYVGNIEMTDEQLVVVNLLVGQLVVALINARLHAEVQKLATTDPLTGLLNRRALWNAAEQMLGRIEGQNGHMAVVMLDIDNFKRINDTYGHAVGDLVLQRLGETISATVRSQDLVGRYGGEEFMVVFNNTDADTTASLATRIWQSVAQQGVDWEGEHVYVTVSLGVAISTPQRRVTFNRLVVAADEAQYRAKVGGKNQVVLGWQAEAIRA